MEAQDLELLEKYASSDPELKTLWEEHMLYEKQLIIFKTCYKEPVPYDNEYYTREFTDVIKLEPSQYPQLFSGYYGSANSK